LSRFVKSEEDFFLAGRSMGLIPIGLSIFATWFGAETIMGSTGAIASEGMAGARAEPFGYALCLFAMAFTISGVFRARGYVNLADFFAKRFAKDSELATALITILVSTIWAAAQLLALSALLKSAIGVPVQLTLIVAVAAVVVYVSLAGIAGDIWTDMIHNVVLVIGLLVVLFALAGKMGGFDAMLGSIEPKQLQLIAPGEGWMGRIDNWAIPILGSLVTQEVIARFLTTKTPTIARNATLMAGSLYMLMGCVPLLIGLAGIHAFPLGDDPDAFLPNIAASILPPVAYVIFAGALLSAVMSVTNANIISVSSMMSINVLGHIHRTAGEKTKLRVARLTTVGAGLAAYLIASSGQSIYQLIALTSVWGQAGILVAVMFGLWSGYGGRRAALWATLVCMAVNLWTLAVGPMLELMNGPQAVPLGKAFTALVAGEAPTVEGYFLLSLLASVAAYVAGAEVDKRAGMLAPPAEVN
jgi:Na+/proline symporter